MEKLKENIFKTTGLKSQKIKATHSELFSKVNWGRFVLFLSFADLLGLTEEESELLFHFLVPTLTQIRE